MTPTTMNQNTLHRELIATTAVHEGEPVRVPRIVVDSGVAGPTLTITAGQHGRELNGIEAVRRFLAWIESAPFHGRVEVFPVVNPPAVAAVRQVVPGETQNINRIWPGDAQGTMTERIAAAVAPFVAETDFLVDLHGWSDWTVCVVLTADAEDQDVAAMARAFGLGYVFCNAAGFQPGNLKTWAKRNGATAIGIELTPQWRLREEAVRAGVRGLINVMKHCGLLDGELELPERQWRYTASTPRCDLMCEHAGLWVQACVPGDTVRAGDTLGHVYSYQTLQLLQRVVSAIDGVVINAGPCHESVECNTVQPGCMLAQVWAAEAI